MTSLTADIPITRICGQRDHAIATLREALDLLRQGRDLALEARKVAATAAAGRSFGLADHRQGAYGQPFRDLDPDAALDAFRAATDAAVWMHLMRATGIERLMDAHAREEFFAQLADEPPPVTEDNVHATLEGLVEDAELIFQRGLARAFASLDRRFKSHDAFKLGTRMILTHVFSGDGFLNYYSTAFKRISDVERVMAVLDGKEPEPGELERIIRESRSGGWGPRRSEAESRYFRIRTFKNGNAHLWFTRDDLVDKANQVLADYYGQVLPDGVPRDVPCQGKAGLPAKDLSFYETPPAVVDELVQPLRYQLPEHAKVLEPSAGEGAVARALIEAGYQVDAIEIDAGRLRVLGEIKGVRVRGANFLRLPAREDYLAVVMNPPFYGTHWQEHVVHAYDFLSPGGILRSVLPATAQVGQSRAHKTFREWAADRGARWTDLPPESFASSGTRVQTVILDLRKPRRRP